MNAADAPLLQQAISVRPYRTADRDEWSAFVDACAEATFFHRIEWRELLQDVFRHRAHYLLAERAGRIAGVLPLAETKSVLFGHALVSLPWAAHGFDLVGFNTPGGQVTTYAVDRFVDAVTAPSDARRR